MCTVQPGVGHRDHALCSPCSPRSPPITTILVEHNSVEPSCLVPVSFTGDSFDGESEQLDKAIEYTKITELECDDTKLVDELPDHSCLADDEIPRVGMWFEHLKLAQDFYVTYAKKVGFISKIRATNFDRMTKQPINQSIHCNREGFWASRVKAPIWKNTMAGVGCRARIYAKFDREKHDWVLLKVELNHSHPCSTRKAVHYHENRELTMHAKCIIEVNNEAGIRPNKTFLALANEVGRPSNLGFSEKDELNPNYFYAVNINEDIKFTSAVWVDARCRASYEYYGEVVSFDTTYSTNRIIGLSSLMSSTYITTDGYQFIHEFDNVLGTKEQKELEDNAVDSRGLIPCSTRSAIERQFQKEYTNEMFRDVQTEFSKKADCTIRAVDEQGKSARVKVEEEILVYETTRYVTFDVHFDRLTHEEFVDCDDEADMLHNVLEDVRAKLVDYRGKMRNNTVATAHNSIITGPSTVFGTEDIQAPSKVTTKSRPKGKRLGYELDKSIRKSMQRKRKSVRKDNRVESAVNQASEAFAQQIAKQGLGGFMSLLNSFDNT
ncbi:hypothetical protein Ahy_A09g045788 [Arachis hypogaea]|uniref:FAR1 domain-containing protein n=1 Tax=Arachis hypogaea TaxID=3818 RepID=A0A445BN75_ARAHY|nr:hypothetical protein Ahy_A09g045788 [Arachis hypogaea]